MLPFVEQFLRYLSSTAHQDGAVKEVEDGMQTAGEPARQGVPHRPRSLRLILATRDMATRIWFHTALDNLLSDYKSLGTVSNLSVEVHLTGEAERIVQPPTKGQSASDFEPSTSSQQDAPTTLDGKDGQEKFDRVDIPEEELRGRPDLPAMIREEARVAASMGQTVGVFVCGPLEMQDHVRNAVATENLSILKNPRSGGMYLHLEHFSWA